MTDVRLYLFSYFSEATKSQIKAAHVHPILLICDPTYASCIILCLCSCFELKTDLLLEHVLFISDCIKCNIYISGHFVN